MNDIVMEIPERISNKKAKEDFKEEKQLCLKGEKKEQW